ncbi:cell surface protein [uncultured Lacinutrix sp.]|uniref:tetratricopeptide repeat protein n=1 Tax=uncultured Lacinutrix sp. TaxID=574032 RepID=UPI00262BD52B|nr:cell surface protein [uncultured Lacinutrix sp.]
MKTNLYLLLVLALLFNCKEEDKTVTNAKDYDVFLIAENKKLSDAKAEEKFWANKLEKTPNQFPYLAKLASAESQLFDATGNIKNLKKAESYLLQLNQKTNQNKAGYLRALARNYISQHRFKASLILLEKAEILAEDLDSTQKMMFDVHMELGNFDIAKSYLEKVVDLNSFDYLIRTAKWNDHIGNLDAAIKYMEMAMAKAESSNIVGLKQWSYTNIADFYGHDGQINKSYQYFLKALALDPNDAYAKKGIAWIVYSHERNPEEALRILNTITKEYTAPDYFLLKAEITEFLTDETSKNKYIASYKNAVQNPQYGEMYNAYNAKLFAENNKFVDSAIAIANREIENRGTPQSYDLLAWSLYNNGEFKKALDIVNMHIINKTFEPEALYHVAEIYKANGMTSELQPLKKELLMATYELGPLMELKINQL